jgi:putative membrane protein
MIISKNFSLRGILGFTGHHFGWLTAWPALVVALYHFLDLYWLSIPWFPLSIVGTAVAFYVGFKNNSAYDRLWEARKIWGGIINTSRSWGMYVKSFVTNQFTEDPLSDHDLSNIKKRMIYRHIAWLYAHRSQLLVASPWEHANQKWLVGSFAKRRQRKFGVGMVDDEVSKTELHYYLPKEEYDRLIKFSNTATQIIDHQSQELKELREKGLIEDFRHMELQRLLSEFYDLQGKNERIKKFPLPRQYANMSFIFIAVFIFILPLGVVSEFAKLGDWAIWFTIPTVALIGWVYVTMELVGDYSENPFEGMMNDIPMLSLCRTIEIDLREMIGDTDIPKPIEAKKNILM